MPEWIAETLKYVGPFGVFCLAMLYLLLRDRNNRRQPNPGPPLTDGHWQQDMKEAQRETNETLGRIERALMLLLGRMGVDPLP